MTVANPNYASAFYPLRSKIGSQILTLNICVFHNQSPQYVNQYQVPSFKHPLLLGPSIIIAIAPEASLLSARNTAPPELELSLSPCMTYPLENRFVFISLIISDIWYNYLSSSFFEFFLPP